MKNVAVGLNIFIFILSSFYMVSYSNSMDKNIESMAGIDFEDRDSISSENTLRSKTDITQSDLVSYNANLKQFIFASVVFTITLVMMLLDVREDKPLRRLVKRYM